MGEYTKMAKCKVNLNELNDLQRKVTKNMANDINYDDNMIRNMTIDKIIGIILSADRVTVETSKDAAETLQAQLKLLGIGV